MAWCPPQSLPLAGISQHGEGRKGGWQEARGLDSEESCLSVWASLESHGCGEWAGPPPTPASGSQNSPLLPPVRTRGRPHGAAERCVGSRLVGFCLCRLIMRTRAVNTPQRRPGRTWTHFPDWGHDGGSYFQGAAPRGNWRTTPGPWAVRSRADETLWGLCLVGPD